jgi:D-sedoheptulose 7-phosphate isomerase
VTHDNNLQQVRSSVESSIAAKQMLLKSTEMLSNIARVAEIIIEAIQRGNKPLFFGNGGSAADAQHNSAEFVGRFAFDRPPLPALALSVNSSCVTAIGNDYGYKTVFARQLEALARPGDVAVGISTSGKSASVLEALVVAKKLGLHTAMLTGANGLKLPGSADHWICIPSQETPRIQECHILVGHIIAELVEQGIYHRQFFGTVA